MSAGDEEIPKFPNLNGLIPKFWAVARLQRGTEKNLKPERSRARVRQRGRCRAYHRAKEANASKGSIFWPRFSLLSIQRPNFL